MGSVTEVGVYGMLKLHKSASVVDGLKKRTKEQMFVACAKDDLTVFNWREFSLV